MLSAVIDRFEENKAVLLIGEAETRVVFPKKFLPENVKEGDYLRLTVAYDGEATSAAKREAESLLQEVGRKNR